MAKSRCSSISRSPSAATSPIKQIFESIRDETALTKERLADAVRRVVDGGVDIAAGTFISRDLVRTKFDGAAQILFEDEFSGAEEKRLTAQNRSYYLKDDLSGPMAGWTLRRRHPRKHPRGG